ncbi:retinoic acid early transcript 1E-like isoform 2-T5 [Dama dama]
MLLKLQGGKSLAHTTGHLLLTLLLTEAGKTLGNAHSLCLDLTVKKQSRPGQPWCQVQGSVDTKPFLQFDSDRNKVRLCCQCEAEQCSGASLLFSRDGWIALLLDTMSITWTLIDPGATGLKEEWENNQELAEYFRKISTGDCSYWLREFLEHWENMLLPEPTVAAL